MLKELTPSYSYYSSWGGSLDENNFNGELPVACARVAQRLAIHNLEEIEEQEPVKNAVCAAIEAQANGTSGLSSYSAGQVSATYSDKFTSSNTVEAAIERELSGTDLVSVVL